MEFSEVGATRTEISGNQRKFTEINGGPRHKAGDQKCVHHFTPKKCFLSLDLGHRERQTYPEPWVDICQNPLPTFSEGFFCQATPTAAVEQPARVLLTSFSSAYDRELQRAPVSEEPKRVVSKIRSQPGKPNQRKASS